MEFNNLNEVLAYFSEKTKEEDKLHIHSIMISGCIFKFELDLDMLLSNFLWKWPNAKAIIFIDILFEKKVDLITFDKKEIEITLNFNESLFKDEVNINGHIFKRDVSFVKCTFEKKALFQENLFKQYFRLSGTTFISDVSFGYSELNKTAFFSGNEDRVLFKGDVTFWGAIIRDARFWDFIFEKDVNFVNTMFECPVFFNRSIFKGKVEFGSVETMGKTIFNGNIYFDQAVINEILLTNILFDTYITFNNATINKIKIDNVIFNRGALSLSGTTIKSVTDEQSARILKIEAIKASNQYVALDLKAKELRLLNRYLPWNYKNLKEKIVLTFNWLSNDYGQNWIRGVLFTIISWIIFFSLFIIVRDGWGETFIWSDSQYLTEAANFFWILSGISGLGENVNWIRFILFFLGKISIGYGIYQTISAFRKYGK